MLLFTFETSPFLALWQIHCTQDLSLFLIFRQTHCKQALDLLVANFWILGQHKNLWALYQGSHTCNLEIHAHNACLNFVVFLTVVTPLLP
jgi:hypothetical protein